jgi:uncharacterized protein (TIGR02996 family)
MAVSVSLLALVKVKNTRDVWPEVFRGLVAALEDAPDDRNQWLVIGDWCEEHGEFELAEAFRWVGGRKSVVAEKKEERYGPNWWLMKGIPEMLLVGGDPPYDHETLAGTAAGIAARLSRVKEMLVARPEGDS